MSSIGSDACQKKRWGLMAASKTPTSTVAASELTASWSQTVHSAHLTPGNVDREEDFGGPTARRESKKIPNLLSSRRTSPVVIDRTRDRDAYAVEAASDSQAVQPNRVIVRAPAISTKPKTGECRQ
jgi:hypothetical protein